MVQRQRDRSAAFAAFGVILAAAALVVAFVASAGAFSSNHTVASDADPTAGDRRDDAQADPNADPAQVVNAAAEAMAGVRSVEFTVTRDGAPVFIDEFERIALNAVHGQFSVPGRARAELDVTVNGDLATKLGAVAIDSEVWISNPVTGDFETLPAGYDIDPSRFFDPQNGWKPLLASLSNVTLAGVDDRGGQRYHIRGTAPAAQVREITVGLVRDQDVEVDFWIHPDTHLVTAAEFTTTVDGAPTHWELELGKYGEEFTIEPPTNVRPASPTAATSTTAA
jgi:lipoprotein LprG